jgi:hypothetical protein
VNHRCGVSDPSTTIATGHRDAITPRRKPYVRVHLARPEDVLRLIARAIGLTTRERELVTGLFG